jgi:hypothetical protein
MWSFFRIKELPDFAVLSTERRLHSLARGYALLVVFIF